MEKEKSGKKRLIIMHDTQTHHVYDVIINCIQINKTKICNLFVLFRLCIDDDLKIQSILITMQIWKEGECNKGDWTAPIETYSIAIESIHVIEYALVAGCLL